MRTIANSIRWIDKIVRHGAMWVAFFAAVTLTGCTSYYLGSTLPPGIRSIHVPTFVNETKEPQLETQTTRATVQEFQRDGTLAVAGADTADARVEVRLTQFNLVPLRFERDQERTAQEYRMVIGAEVVFFRTSTDEVLVRRNVIGDADFEFLGDMASSKLRILPEASRDLAHKIVQLMVEYW
jgi:hypothetical protein